MVSEPHCGECFSHNCGLTRKERSRDALLLLFFLPANAVAKKREKSRLSFYPFAVTRILRSLFFCVRKASKRWGFWCFLFRSQGEWQTQIKAPRARDAARSLTFFFSKYVLMCFWLLLRKCVVPPVKVTRCHIFQRRSSVFLGLLLFFFLETRLLLLLILLI